MSDQNQMMLLLLAMGGLAAMVMSNRSPTLNLTPNINMGTVPEFDADQNIEDIQNKTDKTVKDLMEIDKINKKDLTKFQLEDPTGQAKKVVNYMMYQVSTMYSALKWLEMYMQKNDLRGVDDLRQGGKFHSKVIDQYQALVELCRTRQTQFLDLWTNLSGLGQDSWMKANQWIVNAPNDVLNRLRAFDNSVMAYKAAMQIMDSDNKQTMDQINSKLVDVYNEIGKLPSAKSFKKMSTKLRSVVANQTIMMQVDEDNAGRLALPMNNGVFANVKRATHQVRAPSEDPFSGKPGDYQVSAQWVDSQGQTQSATMSMEQAMDSMKFNDAFGRPTTATGWTCRGWMITRWRRGRQSHCHQPDRMPRQTLLKPLGCLGACTSRLTRARGPSTVKRSGTCLGSGRGEVCLATSQRTLRTRRRPMRTHHLDTGPKTTDRQGP